MSNENNNSKKMIFGLILGAAIGATTLYLIKSARDQKTPILNKIGKAISEVGDALEHTHIESVKDLTPDATSLSGIVNWIANGLQMLKKMK